VRRGEAFDERLLSDQNLTHVRALNEIAARRGQSLAQMAIAWVLRDPRVSSALLGASSVGQLAQNVAALAHLDFTAAELAEIEGDAVEGEINLWAPSSDA
jgi:L-glyceraldehyde 3-phosphate reductase